MRSQAGGVRVFLLMVVCSLSGMAFTRRFGSTPATGVHVLSIPYYAQQGSFWCGPANIQMWHAYVNGGTPFYTQEQIYDFMHQAYPDQVGDLGSSVQGIAYGASQFTGRGMSVDYYAGDAEELRRSTRKGC